MNIKIHPIGIGTSRVGGKKYTDGTFAAIYDKDEEYIDLLKFSLSLGQNHIDTAAIYGAGHTEEVIGRATRHVNRGDIFIATKVWKSHVTRLGVTESIKNSIRRLATTYIDLLYVHMPYEEEPMEQYISGLNDALEKGYTKYIGLSNFNIAQLKQAVSISSNKISFLQLRCNMTSKQNLTTELKTYCEDKDIKIVAHSPLAKGNLAKIHNDTIVRLCEKYQINSVQLGLSWLTSQNLLTVPSALNKDHIIQNNISSHVQLSKLEIEEIHKNVHDQTF